MEPAGDADPRGKRDPRDFALWKGHKPERARHRELADAVGPRPAGLAPGVLGDGREVPRRRVRHPRRRARPALPAPRERAGPVDARPGSEFARFWMHNALVTAAGEKMSKSLGNGALVSEVTKRFPARAAAALPGPAALPLDRSSTPTRRSPRPRPPWPGSTASSSGPPSWSAASTPGAVPEAFVAAMDDDLGTPAARGRAARGGPGRQLRPRRGDRDRVRDRLAEVTGMLDVLGLTRDSPTGRRGSGRPAAGARVVDGLVAALLDQRQEARARRDFAAADADPRRARRPRRRGLRHPAGPRWSLSGDGV